MIYKAPEEILNGAGSDDIQPFSSIPSHTLSVLPLTSSYKVHLVPPIKEKLYQLLRKRQQKYLKRKRKK
jgi:hypothetical protein